MNILLVHTKMACLCSIVSEILAVRTQMSGSDSNGWALESFGGRSAHCLSRYSRKEWTQLELPNGMYTHSFSIVVGSGTSDLHMAVQGSQRKCSSEQGGSCMTF